jgi:hypothetical protein
VVRAIREAIARRLGHRPVSVTVAASHTHSAPASQPLRNCGTVDPNWLREAQAVLVEVAVRAVGDLRPARLGVGAGRVPGVTGNRRAPGFPDSNAGPNDDELGVIRVETTEGAPIACLVNFACHPVILGSENLAISADFPGEVVRLVRERLGATALFTNGATGDINPLRRGSWDDVAHLARAVVAETERAWAAAETTSDVSLAVASETLRLPLLPLPPRAELEDMVRRFGDEEATARAAGQGTQARVAAAFRAWAEHALTLDPSDLFSDAEIQALRIGDAALVAVPAELFVHLGLQIKQRLAKRGIRPTFVLGYANGNIGYVPTRDAYGRGGYEVETAHRFYGYSSCVAPEAGERIVECAVRLAGGTGEGHDG